MATKPPQTNWRPGAKPEFVESAEIEALTICDDAPKDNRKENASKYSELFEKMKPGQAIKCPKDKASTISQALRKWLEKTGERGLRAAQTSDYGDGMGRVWKLKAQ